MKPISEMIEICDRATPGPWRYEFRYFDYVKKDYHRVLSGRSFPVCYVESAEHVPIDKENLSFIAQFNPSFVKQLLTRLQDYEEVLKLVRTGEVGAFSANDVLHKHGAL